MSNPPPANIFKLAALAAARKALSVPIIENHVYRDVALMLDGYTFKNCAFYNCNLHTVVGNFILDRCWLGDCRIYFDGNSIRILKLASLLNDAFLREQCSVTRAADGTFSID